MSKSLFSIGIFILILGAWFRLSGNPYIEPSGTTLLMLIMGISAAYITELVSKFIDYIINDFMQ